MADSNDNLEYNSEDCLRILRKGMCQASIDVLVIFTSDAHLLEYTPAHDKAREYFSKFTGSAGTLVVSNTSAWLYTDSRYYIQAREELADGPIVLMKDGYKGTPLLRDFLRNILAPGQILGMDLRTVSAFNFENIRHNLPESISIVDASQVIDEAWEHRPSDRFTSIRMLADDISGQPFEDKLSELKVMLKNDSDSQDAYIVFSDPCDIMWLFNLRARDVEYVNVALSYAIVSQNVTKLFVNIDMLEQAAKDRLEKGNVILCAYEGFEQEIANVVHKTVLVDYINTNANIVKLLNNNDNDIRRIANCRYIKRYVKNAAEREQFIKYHMIDGAALIKFIIHIKRIVRKGTIDEYAAGKYLDELRLSNAECEGLSFETICAYAANGAIVHYSASKDKALLLKDKGLLLVDSGAHYPSCTTDVTRTIVLGELTAKEKEDYTAVLKGNLDLMSAVFNERTCGENLDILAHQPVWEIGEDYGHGTGHGIGAGIGVHEMIPCIRNGVGHSDSRPPFCEGMVVSDEPGIYIEGSHGVRLETQLMCVKDNEGSMLRFIPLTVVPFEPDAILIDRLSPKQRDVLNSYHEYVYASVSNFLNEDERKDLAYMTKKI